MRHRSLAVCCIAALAFAAAPAADETLHCDRYLPISTQNPFGYRMRGDRCEGIYVQPVASTPLVVASFGQLNVPQPPTATGALVVNWGAGSRDVRLRAVSLKPKTYYRMDRWQAAGSRSYRWPTDVLAALKLTARDIGIVAWTKQKHGSGVREVYLPVRIGAAPRGRENIYELVLVPGNELSEVFVALTSVRAGDRRVQVSASKPLLYGIYPAGRSVRIPVGPLSDPGLYVVDISATLRDGGAVSHDFWFTHTPARSGNGR